jgi:hypothetical protein
VVTTLSSKVTGTLGTAAAGAQTGTLAKRIFRNGVPGTCSVSGYAGLSGSGSYTYNAYTIANPTAAAVCKEMTFNKVVASQNIHAFVMKSPFVPADINDPTRFVQVSGNSVGGTPFSQTMGFNIPANESVLVVLYDVDAVAGSFFVTFNDPTWVVSNQVACNGNTANIAVSASGGTAPYTYNWGGGVTTQNRTGVSAGTYTVTVTDNNSSTVSQSYTVTEPTVLSATASSVVISATKTQVTATPSGGTAPYSYQWNPDNGTTATISVTPMQAYNVTVTDTNGCTTANMGTALKVAQNNNNTIVVNEDKSKLEQSSAEAVKNDVLIVPNPASELAKLNFTEPIFAKINLSIFDVAGKMIEQKTFDNSNAIEINLANYPSGVYLVKINTAQGEKFAKRLVVQHF